MPFGHYIAHSKLKDRCDKGHAVHAYIDVHVYSAVRVYSVVYMYNAGHMYSAVHVYKAGHFHSACIKYNKWPSILLCARVQL